MAASVKPRCFWGGGGAWAGRLHGVLGVNKHLSNLCKWLLMKTLWNYSSVCFTGIILINIGVRPLSHLSKFCFIHSNIPFCYKCSCLLLLAVPLHFPFPVPNWFSFYSFHVTAVISIAQECLLLEERQHFCRCFLGYKIIQDLETKPRVNTTIRKRWSVLCFGFGGLCVGWLFCV